ncbi:MAG TPA: hypothetical protein PK731_12145, partial [Verrucomicrobiota bacterium]|nr:hypothetical protein [Verrucomicrobiota bacterium]
MPLPASSGANPRWANAIQEILTIPPPRGANTRSLAAPGGVRAIYGLGAARCFIIFSIIAR